MVARVDAVEAFFDVPGRWVLALGYLDLLDLLDPDCEIDPYIVRILLRRAGLDLEDRDGVIWSRTVAGACWAVGRLLSHGAAAVTALARKTFLVVPYAVGWVTGKL